MIDHSSDLTISLLDWSKADLAKPTTFHDLQVCATHVGWMLLMPVGSFTMVCSHTIVYTPIFMLSLNDCSSAAYFVCHISQKIPVHTFSVFSFFFLLYKLFSTLSWSFWSSRVLGRDVSSFLMLASG